MTLFGKIIAGFLIMGGVGTASYFIIKEDSAPVAIEETKAEEIKQEEVVQATTTENLPAAKKMAFSQFIKTDTGSYKCEVNQNIKEMTTKGIVYVKNAKIKGEFATSLAGQNITSTMIMKDGYSYTWTSAAPTMGFKIKLQTTPSPASNVTQTSMGTQGSYVGAFDTIGDYSCTAQTVDDSIFELPATVTFREQTN